MVQWSAPAWAACCALYSTSCVQSSLSTGYITLRLTTDSRLTRIFFCGGAEEDAESGLEVGRFARGVSPAELDAVGQHEGARSRVEHVVGGGVDVARDELEVRVLL